MAGWSTTMWSFGSMAARALVFSSSLTPTPVRAAHRPGVLVGIWSRTRKASTPRATSGRLKLRTSRPDKDVSLVC